MKQHMTDYSSKGSSNFEKNLYHCSGCEEIMDCPMAFKYESENCDCYVRSIFHDCHKCLNFGKACQKSGLIRCDFAPRVPEAAAGHAMTRGRHK